MPGAGAASQLSRRNPPQYIMKAAFENAMVIRWRWGASSQRCAAPDGRPLARGRLDIEDSAVSDRIPYLGDPQASGRYVNGGSDEGGGHGGAEDAAWNGGQSMATALTVTGRDHVP